MNRVLAFLMLVASTASATPPKPEAPLDALAWLEGTWRGTFDGLEDEEHFTSPRGGLILWTAKALKAGRVVGFEFGLFEVRDGKPVLVPYPDGVRSKDAFPLERLDVAARSATFSNPAHDWPTHFTYARVAPNRLTITLSGPTPAGPKVKTADLERVP